MTTKQVAWVRCDGSRASERIVAGWGRQWARDQSYSPTPVALCEPHQIIAIPMFVRISIVVVLAVAILVVAYSLLRTESLPTPSAGIAGSQPQQGVNANAAEAETAATPTAATAGSPTDADRTIIEQPRTATITGRCVDASGEGLVGVVVTIYGSMARGERAKLWLATHDAEPVWSKVEPCKTGVDGRFSIAFVPPPPFTFTLGLRVAGLVTTCLDWDAIESGAVIDVGDIQLTPGVTLRGRVIDSRGAAVAKAYVNISPDQVGDAAAATTAAGDAAMRTRQVLSTSFRAAADGTFVADNSLLEGTYSVHVSGEELVSPATLEVSLAERGRSLEIVVKSLADIPHVSGRVVDDHGQPVADVEVGAQMTARFDRFSTRTRRDGTFVLRANKPPKAATIELVVRADDYEYDAQPLAVAWGTEDVTLHVVRGGELTVRVTDPELRAIEQYTVRMVPRERAGYSSDDGRARSEGRHEDGIAVVPGLLRGKWLIVVDFPDRPGSVVLMTPLQVDTIGPVRVDLVLQPSAERIVRVVRGDGSPVANTSVSACDLFGTPWHDSRPIFGYEHWQMNAGASHVVLRVASATSDEAGRAVLRGPAGREFLLQVESSQHLPKLVEAVRLDAPGELQVVVQTGAELHGHIEPPAALAELRLLAGVTPGAAFGSRAPHLQLVAVEGYGRFPSVGAQVTDEQPLRIANDGTFSAGGLPPGAWHVELNYWHGDSTTRARVGTVALAEGQASELLIAMPWLLPGTLEGTVLWNGAPFAERPVTVIPAGRGQYLQAKTDSQGRFTLRAAQGSYSLQLSVSSEDMALDLTAPETVEITSGEVATAEFRVTSGRVRLRVLAPDGAPQSRFSVMVARAGETFRYQPATGVDGKVELQLPPGNWTFAVLPRRLDNNDEEIRIWREGNAAGLDDPFAPHRLVLGELLVQAGSDDPLELRLPIEWQR